LKEERHFKWTLGYSSRRTPKRQQLQQGVEARRAAEASARLVWLHSSEHLRAVWPSCIECVFSYSKRSVTPSGPLVQQLIVHPHLKRSVTSSGPLVTAAHARRRGSSSSEEQRHEEQQKQRQHAEEAAAGARSRGTKSSRSCSRLRSRNSSSSRSRISSS
jgi:hypothetical protein